MIGVWIDMWRLLDSLCLSNIWFITRKSCNIRSSLLALGVKDVWTIKWRWDPSEPIKVKRRKLLPCLRTIGISAPTLSNFTVWSGAISCNHSDHVFYIRKCIEKSNRTLNELDHKTGLLLRSLTVIEHERISLGYYHLHLSDTVIQENHSVKS